MTSAGQKTQTPTLNLLLQKPTVMSAQNTLSTLNPTFGQNSSSPYSSNSSMDSQQATQQQHPQPSEVPCVPFYPQPNMGAADPRWAFAAARFMGDPKTVSDPSMLKSVVGQYPPHSMPPGGFQPMTMRPSFMPPNAAATGGNPMYFGVQQSYGTQGNFVGPGPPPPAHPGQSQSSVSTPPMRNNYPMEMQETQQMNGSSSSSKSKNNVPSPASSTSSQQSTSNAANNQEQQQQNAPQHRTVAALRQETSSMGQQQNDGRATSSPNGGIHPSAVTIGGMPNNGSPMSQMRHSPVSPVPMTLFQPAANYPNCFPNQAVVGGMPPGATAQMIFGADNRFKFANAGPQPPIMAPATYQLQYPGYPASAYANGPNSGSPSAPAGQPPPQQRFRGPMPNDSQQQQQPPSSSSSPAYRAPIPVPAGQFFAPHLIQQAQNQQRMSSAFRNAPNGFVGGAQYGNDDRLCVNSPMVSGDVMRTNGRNTPTSVDGRRTSTPKSETKKKGKKVAKESLPSTPAPNTPDDASSNADDLESSLSSPSWPRTPMSPHNASRGAHPNQVQNSMGPPAQPVASTSSVSSFQSAKESAASACTGPALVQKLLGDYRLNPCSFQEWEDRRRFFEHYVQFAETIAMLQLSGHPSVSKQNVDLFRLYRSVKQNGGFVTVTKKKIWRELCALFNINQSNSASGQLKKQYSKFLLPYECYYDLNKADPAPIRKSCESKKKHKPKAKAVTPQQPQAPNPNGASNSGNSLSADGHCPPTISSYAAQAPTPSSFQSSQNSQIAPTPQQQQQLPPTYPPVNRPSETATAAMNPFDDSATRLQVPSAQGTNAPSASSPQQQQIHSQPNIPAHHQQQPSGGVQYPVRMPNPTFSSTFPPQMHLNSAPSQAGGFPGQSYLTSGAPPVDSRFASQTFNGHPPNGPAYLEAPYAKNAWPEHVPPPQNIPNGPIPPSSNANFAQHSSYNLMTAPSPAHVVSPPNQYIVASAPRLPTPQALTVSSASTASDYGRAAPLPSSYAQQQHMHPSVSSGQVLGPQLGPVSTIPPSLNMKESSSTKDGRSMPSTRWPDNISKPLSIASNNANLYQKQFSLPSPFPPNSVEATTPKVARRRKFYSKDIGKVDAWRLIMALKSGLSFETSWALNVLTVLLYDDSCIGFFDLKTLPGFLDVLMELFRKNLAEVFDGFDLDDDSSFVDETTMNNNEEFVDKDDFGVIDESAKVGSATTGKFVQYKDDFTRVSRRGKPVRYEKCCSEKCGSFRPKLCHDCDGDNHEDDSAYCGPSEAKRFKCEAGTWKIPLNFSDDIDSDEILARSAPPVIFDGRRRQRSKSLDICLCISNIVRGLSYVPGNEVYMSKLRWSSLLNAESKLLTCVHRHVSSKKQSTATMLTVENIEAMDTACSTDDKSEEKFEPVDLSDDFWYFDDVLTLTDDAFAILCNVSSNLDLYEYDERTVEMLLSAIIHWAVCKAPIAADALLPNAIADATPPYRCALEILCKLSIFERNVDLILATPPWSRIETLVGRLASFLSLSEDIILREFSIVLLHAFCNVSQVVCAVAAKQTPAVSNLISILEFADAEMHRVLQFHGMATLRDNPEIIGTSVGMLRRAASILLSISKVSMCRSKFNGFEMRLINFTMSQLMDSRVGATIAEVLYELQQKDETGVTAEASCGNGGAGTRSSTSANQQATTKNNNHTETNSEEVNDGGGRKCVKAEP